MPLRLHVVSNAAYALAACVLLVFPAPVSAQSSAYATVSGTVLDPVGVPIAQAQVTLTPLGGDGSLETTTGGGGAFTLALVRPGSYELRIEALGYRPLLARTLTLAGGDERTVDLTPTPEPPPVMTVDTVILAASSSSRWQAGSMRLGSTTIDALPHRLGGLASVAAMSTAFDETLGAQGLPSDETVVMADGVPFYRAAHPSVRSGASPMPLFPGGLVGSVTAATSPSDMEWLGAAGGYVSVGTRSSTAGLEAGGAYSGDVGWFSDELDLETPSLLSYEGSLRGTAPLRDDGSQLVVAADVLEHQIPQSPRISADMGSSLASLDPEIVAGLTEPAVETYSRYVGLARLDLNSGTSGRTFVRAMGSYSRRAFEGAGPLASSPASTLAEESVDLSLAGGYVSQVTNRTTVELRGGVSGSYRDFKGPFDGLVPTWVAPSGPARVLGSPSYAAGESSRTDVTLMPIVRHRLGLAALKGGVSIRLSDHTMERGAPDLEERVYPDLDGLLAGEGYGGRISAPEASFGTREIGVFAQYDAPLGEAVRFRLGARYDHEHTGSDTPALNADWRDATGLANDDYPTSFNQFGLGGALTWDVAPSGGTRVTLAGSLREGDVDPRALFEVLSFATDATAVEYLGGGLAWPYGTIPGGASALPTLTLLGPDTRAPRTTTFNAGVRQTLTASSSLFVEGAVRRTDFLMRRRNLNLPVSPRLTDAYGRSVYGTLEQEGSLVAATGDDVRRFSDFGDVWALDPDGWSEHRGLTVGVEHASAIVDLFGSYTYSETTDNRVGAAHGAIDASLGSGLPDDGDAAWDEGVSDFDAPHRAAAGATFRLGVAELSALYRYRSGYPFTPGYRVGVDANGDGSVRNDVAWVPTAGELSVLLDDWPCLDDQVEGFAERNSCRAPGEHAVNARLRVRLGDIGGRTATLTLDGLNLVEPTGGLVDTALLLVDPAGSISTSGGVVTVPVTVNDGFGDVLYPSSRGRMLRIGVRVGG